MEHAFETEDGQSGKFLTFMLGDDAYGLTIRVVTEIVCLQDITPAPNFPDYIKGIINLRGKVIPVMDVRARFKMLAREPDERTCIVVVRVDGQSVGLIVDTVSEVVDIDDAQIEPPPKLHAGAGSPVIQGVGKLEDGVKILLNAHTLISQYDIRPANDSHA